MPAANRAQRRALKGRTIAGLSAVAVTGLFATYLQALRSPSAYATTTCTVTVGTDNVGSPDPGSLRDCINQIESASGGTIDFAVSSVTLAGSLPAVHNSLAIDGGVNGVTINGGGPSSDFRMLSAYVGGKILDISHVTVQDFHGNFTSGLAVMAYEDNATVNLTDVTIQDTSSAHGSGAVYIAGHTSSLTISDSTFTRNTVSGNGGAVRAHWGGTFVIDGSDFSDNSAARGGALSFAFGQATATISDSTFDGNTSVSYGGAISQYEGSLSIARSEFTDNTGYGGGALYFYSGNVGITDSTFDGNTGQHGSGVIHFYGSSGNVTATNSAFSNNTGVGAAVSDGGNSWTVERSSFVDNYGSGNGALQTNGPISLTNSYIGGNTAPQGSTSVVATNGAVTLNFTTIANNAITGAAVLANGNMTLNGSVIAQNDACDPRGSVTDQYTMAMDSRCGLTGTGSVNNVTAGALNLSGRSTETINGVVQYFNAPGAGSVLISGSPSGDIGTGVTVDQLGNTRTGSFTIGSLQYRAAPAAPTALAATPGDGQASISFTAGDPGSSSITNYEYSTDNGSTWQPFNPAVTSSPVTISGLSNNQTYQVKLRAVSIVGSGAESTAVPVTPVPSGEAPAAPLAPEVLAGVGKVRVSVARGTGGGTPTDFTITAAPGGATCTVHSTTGGACDVTGLVNGRTYTFTATATNANGTSAVSTRSEAAQPGEPKAPEPQPINRVLKPGQYGYSEGGVPQRIDISPDSDSQGLVIEGNGFAMGLDGLKPNGEPMGLGADGVLVLAGDREVQANGDGFLPNSSVDLYLDPQVTPRSRHARAASTATYVGTVKVKRDGTFSGTATLPADVSAGNHSLQAVGASRGNLARVLTLGVYVASTPRAVRHLTATSTKPGRASLTWSLPKGSAIAGVDGYKVAYQPLGMRGYMPYATVSDPFDTVTGLIPGCSYVFRVRAVNSAGVGTPAYTDVTVIATGARAKPAGDLRCLVQ